MKLYWRPCVPLCSLSASGGLVVICENKFQLLLSFDSGVMAWMLKSAVCIWRLRFSCSCLTCGYISVCSKFSLNKSCVILPSPAPWVSHSKTTLLSLFLLENTAVLYSPTACWTYTCLFPTNCTTPFSCATYCHLSSFTLLECLWWGEEREGEQCFWDCSWILETNGSDWTLIMEIWRKEYAVSKVGVTGKINSKALLLKRNGDTETVPAVRMVAGREWLPTTARLSGCNCRGELNGKSGLVQAALLGNRPQVQAARCTACK